MPVLWFSEAGDEREAGGAEPRRAEGGERAAGDARQQGVQLVGLDHARRRRRHLHQHGHVHARLPQEELAPAHWRQCLCSH